MPAGPACDVLKMSTISGANLADHILHHLDALFERLDASTLVAEADPRLVETDDSV